MELQSERFISQLYAWIAGIGHRSHFVTKTQMFLFPSHWEGIKAGDGSELHNLLHVVGSTKATASF